MVSSVTIVGSNDTPITLRFDATANFALAQQIAARIAAAIASGQMVTSFDTDGAPPHLPQGVAGAFVQTTDGFVALPHGYTTDLVTKPGDAVVIGSGAANEMILSDLATNLTFVGAGGSGTVVAGGGTDRLFIEGNGAWSLNTGNGNDYIQIDGHGSDSIAAGGGANTIMLEGGRTLIRSSGDDTVFAGGGAVTIDATTAQSDLVRGGDANLLFVGGFGGATITGGQGSDTYFGATGGPVGPQLIQGGSRGNNLLVAGDGAATLIGGGNGDRLLAYGSADQLLIAGAGNETLSAAASAGNDTLFAGRGNDMLIGGSGNDTFYGGAGHATIQAGGGSDVFAFVRQAAQAEAEDHRHAPRFGDDGHGRGHGEGDGGGHGGSTLVTGITDPASIKISLQGYGPNEEAYALNHQTVVNGSVTMSLSDGTRVTFQDITTLKPSNFI